MDKNNADTTLVDARCVCVCVCRPYSLVPSSDTIPRPSALFCLSKAFRSNTLLAAHSGSSLTTHLHASDITAASRPAKDKTRLTCRFASKPEHSGRIPHPFYPSNNPAFSAQRDSEEWQHCWHLIKIKIMYICICGRSVNCPEMKS